MRSHGDEHRHFEVSIELAGTSGKDKRIVVEVSFGLGIGVEAQGVSFPTLPLLRRDVPKALTLRCLVLIMINDSSINNSS